MEIPSELNTTPCEFNPYKPYDWSKERTKSIRSGKWFSLSFRKSQVVFRLWGRFWNFHYEFAWRRKGQLWNPD